MGLIWRAVWLDKGNVCSKIVHLWKLLVFILNDRENHGRRKSSLIISSFRSTFKQYIANSLPLFQFTVTELEGWFCMYKWNTFINYNLKCIVKNFILLKIESNCRIRENPRMMSMAYLMLNRSYVYAGRVTLQRQHSVFS